MPEDQKDETREMRVDSKADNSNEPSDNDQPSASVSVSDATGVADRKQGRSKYGARRPDKD